MKTCKPKSTGNSKLQRTLRLAAGLVLTVSAVIVLLQRFRNKA